MNKDVLGFFKPFAFFVFVMISLSSFGQQANTLQLLQNNAADYDVKVFAPAIHAKVSNTSEAAVQKKFKSIAGLISIDRSQQDYFILKLDKAKAKDILEKYFKLTSVQTAILP